MSKYSGGSSLIAGDGWWSRGAGGERGNGPEEQEVKEVVVPRSWRSRRWSSREAGCQGGGRPEESRGGWPAGGCWSQLSHHRPPVNLRTPSINSRPVPGTHTESRPGRHKKAVHGGARLAATWPPRPGRGSLRPRPGHGQVGGPGGSAYAMLGLSCSWNQITESDVFCKADPKLKAME